MHKPSELEYAAHGFQAGSPAYSAFGTRPCESRRRVSAISQPRQVCKRCNPLMPTEHMPTLSFAAQRFFSVCALVAVSVYSEPHVPLLSALPLAAAAAAVAALAAAAPPAAAAAAAPAPAALPRVAVAAAAVVVVAAADSAATPRVALAESPNSWRPLLEAAWAQGDGTARAVLSGVWAEVGMPEVVLP